MSRFPVSRVIPAIVFTLFGCATSPEAVPSAGPTQSADDVAPVVVATEVIEAEEEAAALSYYTRTQASRGDRFFEETCLSCHSSSEFRGRSFQRTWRGR